MAEQLNGVIEVTPVVFSNIWTSFSLWSNSLMSNTLFVVFLSFVFFGFMLSAIIFIFKKLYTPLIKIINGTFDKSSSNADDEHFESIKR
jgi:hypothetical protein